MTENAGSVPPNSQWIISGPDEHGFASLGPSCLRIPGSFQAQFCLKMTILLALGFGAIYFLLLRQDQWALGATPYLGIPPLVSRLTDSVLGFLCALQVWFVTHSAG